MAALPHPWDSADAGRKTEPLWLDMNGHPQTEATHITERFRRRNFGHIDLEVTIDDPAAYTRPWTVALAGLDFFPDEDLIEAICENEKDFPHVVGK